MTCSGPCSPLCNLVSREPPPQGGHQGHPVAGRKDDQRPVKREQSVRHNEHKGGAGRGGQRGRWACTRRRWETHLLERSMAECS